MNKVFIIHGLDSSPNKAWRPWLMGELAKHDIYACSLAMPLGKEPTCESWIETIKNAVKDEENIYLVGHSLGARAVLKFLENTNVKIKGVVIVAGRYGKPKSGVLESFYNDPLDFSKIKKTTEHFVVIHGDNDPNIPYEDGKKLSESLDCEFVTIIGGGHLSGKAKWFELPEARDSLLKMIKN